MKFLEERPCLEQFERVDGTAPTWVATVADERLCVDDQIRDRLKRAAHKELGNTKDPLIKILMVTSPNGTQVFATWTRGLQNNVAKLFFKKVFEPFGDGVVRQALGNVHVMNARHEMQIKKWILKCELEEDQDKAALLQIEEGFSDEKTKAKFLKIAQQQIDERKARYAERQALCDETGEMDCDDDKQKLTEEHLQQCVMELLNGGAESKLFVVKTKPESEREGAVTDSLPKDILHEQLSELQRLRQDGMDTDDVKTNILETVVKTNYDLAQANLLPNVDNDRNAKGPFLNRAINVTNNLIGEAPDKKAVESKLAKLQGQDKLKCAQCKKKADHARHYRNIETGICYPIASLASEPAKRESIAIFCSLRCQQEWDETLRCPTCKTFEWKRDVKGKAPYPCPFKLLDNLTLYNYCRQYVPGTPVCPITRQETRMIQLPLCTTCSSTMMPRTPDAPHLTLCWSYDDMRPTF
jgi:hypothetical protein